MNDNEVVSPCPQHRAVPVASAPLPQAVESPEAYRLKIAMGEASPVDSIACPTCKGYGTMPKTCEPVESPRATGSEALSIHRCKICGTRWLLWPDSVHGGGWNLLDRWQRPGSCCDNVAMGEQIEHLRDIPWQEQPAPAAPLPRETSELLRLGERASRWFADGTRTDEPLDIETAIKCIDGALGALEAVALPPPLPRHTKPEHYDRLTEDQKKTYAFLCDGAVWGDESSVHALKVIDELLAVALPSRSETWLTAVELSDIGCRQTRLVLAAEGSNAIFDRPLVPITRHERDALVAMALAALRAETPTTKENDDAHS